MKPTVFKKLDAGETATCTVPVGNVDSERIHADQIDKVKVLEAGIALRKRTERVAECLLAGIVRVRHVHDAIYGQGSEAPCFGASAVLLCVVETKLGGLETKLERSFPKSGGVVGQEPGIAGAIFALLADDVIRITEPVSGGATGCGDVGRRNGDALTVLLLWRRGISQSGEGASEDDVAVRSLGDGGDGSVEACERHVCPIGGPYYSVGGVAA